VSRALVDENNIGRRPTNVKVGSLCSKDKNHRGPGPLKKFSIIVRSVAGFLIYVYSPL
jgi:hypothetical protein